MLEKLFLSDVAMAQAAAQAKGPSTFETLLPVAVIFVILYFVMIRPQQKRMRDQTTLLETLKPGDEVVTSGGIIGRIKSVADTFVSLDIANSTTIKVLKSHISSHTKPKDGKELVPAKAK